MFREREAPVRAGMSIASLASLGVLLASCSGDTPARGEPPSANDAAAPDASLAFDASAGGDDGGVAIDGAPDVAPPSPEVIVPRTGIEPSELAVVVNDSDPLSVAVAAYYMTARKIPAANLVHVQIAGSPAAIDESTFAPLKTQVDAALAGTPVQALLLTWTKPYAVGKMSITSAFAIGYRAIGDTCTDPKSQYQSLNPYATNRASTRPFTDLAFRPVMTLPATTIAEAQSIIDHGVAADDTWPAGSAYLMSTSDQTRSARCVTNASFGYTNQCLALTNVWDSAESGIAASIVSADSITNKTDVLFYVQGLASVPDLTTNTFLPGAVADHLTSYGGQIPTSGQMSAFEFLKAGATGSYGTVVEPCAYTQKFPDPSVLIPSYFGGSSLIEAYWKSVQWPAEGIFIGEPLARPFGIGFKTSFANGALTIRTTTMVPGKTYVIEAGDSAAGPFTIVMSDLEVAKYKIATFTIENATRRTYRFRAL